MVKYDALSYTLIRGPFLPLTPPSCAAQLPPSERASKVEQREHGWLVEGGDEGGGAREAGAEPPAGVAAATPARPRHRLLPHHPHLRRLHQARRDPFQP